MVKIRAITTGTKFVILLLWVPGSAVVTIGFDGVGMEGVVLCFSFLFVPARIIFSWTGISKPPRKKASVSLLDDVVVV